MKLKIIFNNKEYRLTEYFFDICNNFTNDYLSFRLTGIKNITNMSYMFYKCNELTSISNISNSYISNFNDNNILNDNESKLENDDKTHKLNEINESNSYDTFKQNSDNESNKTNIIFKSENNSLPISTIPKDSNYLSNDIISEVNKDNCISSKPTLKSINMSYMFYECSSLISLPDLSKWNITKVKNMSYMFWGCNSLISLPDIFKNKYNLL